MKMTGHARILSKSEKVKTSDPLNIENDTLRSRLQEMEDALNAIRNGEVDAIMVTGHKGEQVYAISSADTPYRTFIEQMSEGAVTLAHDGTVLYCNQRFATIVGAPYDKVIGTQIVRFISVDDKPKFEAFLRQLTHASCDVMTVLLENAVHLRLSIHLMPKYLEGDNYILIATDITDLKHKEKDLLNTVDKLGKHIDALRTLRINNISETLDMHGTKNQLRANNTKLYKEIIKLNRLVERLKQKK